MKHTLIGPDVCRSKYNAPIDMWVYRYESPHGDVLCIGTHGAPKSGKLSLGGFRIVPQARAALPGFSPEQEAVGLGVGMEEKAYWSKLFKIAGPLGISELSRVVGGKCAFLPAAHGRIGESRDVDALSWALDCLMDFEETSGVKIVTGQDLGHGDLTSGESSLSFMSKRFRGVIVADTSKPTGEGNYQLMRGFADAAGLIWKQLHIGVLGCGNIGHHIVTRLKEDGVMMTVLEPKASTKLELSALGVTALDPCEKERFVNLPMDLIAVNAVGGTLDTKTCEAFANNKQTKLVSGCENLVMPNASDSEILRRANKMYVHTELCGMMGYLTAVENYLCVANGTPFNVDSMFEAAKGLNLVANRVSAEVFKNGFAASFEDAARTIYS